MFIPLMATEEEITNFVLESPAGPQPPKKTGYSKYDSPEPDEIPLHSPVHSDGMFCCCLY